jgi:hypothetical protein
MSMLRNLRIHRVVGPLPLATVSLFLTATIAADLSGSHEAIRAVKPRDRVRTASHGAVRSRRRRQWAPAGPQVQAEPTARGKTDEFGVSPESHRQRRGAMSSTNQNASRLWVLALALASASRPRGCQAAPLGLDRGAGESGGAAVSGGDDAGRDRCRVRRGRQHDPFVRPPTGRDDASSGPPDAASCADMWRILGSLHRRRLRLPCLNGHHG